MIPPKVIDDGESEPDVNFLNFFRIDFFRQRSTFFFIKGDFFIRIDRRVTGVEKSESDVNFLNFFSDRFF